jgi:hypothetical protein
VGEVYVPCATEASLPTETVFGLWLEREVAPLVNPDAGAVLRDPRASARNTAEPMNAIEALPLAFRQGIFTLVLR